LRSSRSFDKIERMSAAVVDVLADEAAAWAAAAPVDALLRPC
jgi:hypothetical protein